MQVDEVVGLQQHVTEFGIADAGVFATETAFHRVLRHHHIDRKVLTDVAEEFEVAKLAHPIEVVHQLARVGSVKVKKLLHLFFDAGDVLLEYPCGQQRALFALAARVANHPSGSTDERNRFVTGLLKTAQSHQLQHATDVQAVCRRIESDVQRAGLIVQPLRQFFVVSGLMNEAAPLKVGEDVLHETTRGW